MKEYIERDAWLRTLKNNKKLFIDGWGGFDAMPPTDKARVDELDNCIALLLELPAADVVERKRGEWVVTECDSGEPDGYPPFIEFHCPFCNEPYSLESGEYNWYYGDDIPLKFCHECGADMRGEKHEAD